MLLDHMKFAIELAERAENYDEVPVGCVIADHNQKLVSYANNSVIENNDPTCHAEIVAIRSACRKLKTTKLLNFSIYITLEPCQMCAAALIQARMGRVIYGAEDKKRGGLGGSIDLAKHKSAHHKMRVEGGIMGKRAKEQLQKWFKQRRLADYQI